MQKKKTQSRRKQHLLNRHRGMFMNLKAVQNWLKKAQDRHNIVLQALPGKRLGVGKSHVHEIDLSKTDFLNHFHNLKKIRTGPAISVGNGKHVHFVTGRTTLNDGHVHRFNFATLIEAPLV